MKITQIQHEPIEKYPYWIVQTGGRDIGGNRVIEQVDLPIFWGQITGLGHHLDAIVATSDLQGTVKDGENEYLLGEKLPEFLSMFIALEYPHLDPKRIGVVLCGDLYANLEKRGGRGDVKDVWRTFNQYFKWVVGVAGNHDDFGDKKTLESFTREPGIHYLHRQIKDLDTIKVGGISGIIGRADKPQRVEENEYLSALKKLLLQQPSMILLHQSPGIPQNNLQGSEEIMNMLEKSPPNLVFSGHSHWDTPLAMLHNGTQVVNLDGRVLILVNDKNVQQMKTSPTAHNA